MTDKLIDFVEKRKKSIEKKRRSFERVMFKNFLGCSTVIDDNGTHYPINLVDISHDGCLIQVPWNVNNHKQFKAESEITLRFYFTQDSFIPAVIKIKYASEYVDNKGDTYARIGCQWDKSLPSFEALNKFIEFIYKFAEFSCADKGDAKVYFL